MGKMSIIRLQQVQTTTPQGAEVIAAKRAGVDTVVLPGDNRKDYDDLPQVIKDDVTVHFAETYDDVFRIAFPDVDK